MSSLPPSPSILYPTDALVSDGCSLYVLLQVNGEMGQKCLTMILVSVHISHRETKYCENAEKRLVNMLNVCTQV